jgi:hypothetical protein
MALVKLYRRRAGAEDISPGCSAPGADFRWTGACAPALPRRRPPERHRTTARLFVRSGAGPDFATLGTLPLLGTEVEVLAAHGLWWQAMSWAKSTV